MSMAPRRECGEEVCVVCVCVYACLYACVHVSVCTRAGLCACVHACVPRPAAGTRVCVYAVIYH